MMKTMMMGFRTLFFFSLILTASVGIAMARADDGFLQLNDEVLGLIVFKSGLHDPSSVLDSWNEEDNYPCSWQFVHCNPATGRVSDVSLDGLGLSGKPGRGLEKLQALNSLSMARNNLTGKISPDLFYISSLQKLNLSNNGLSGLIPASLANMSSLKFLDLSENSLSGPLPDNIFGNCLSLRFLSLAGNSFEGSIPSSLYKSISLNHLNLSNNFFSGNPDFVAGFWSLTRLRTLDLSGNGLSGPVPEGVSGVHNLKDLHLQGNQFSGPVPGDIGLCPHLMRLDLSANQLTDEIPDSIQSLKSLVFLSLSNNGLTGNFPPWIGELISLEYLDFSRNQLVGVLPFSMGGLESLRFLSLSDNKLTGDIPKSLANSGKLSVMSLRGNAFNGSIPEALFGLELEEVDLSKNQLGGSIPPGSAKFFESLRELDLSSNQLTGDIPPEMGLFHRLTYLNLSCNNFQSSIPPELGYIQNLTVLDLRKSALNGSIPGDICDSGSLAILQLDGNSLTGPIPEEIGNCSSLYLLSLSHNSLNGQVPKSISKVTNLKILKLEYNQLSGELPKELGMLESLLAVNISYNRLIGRLPVGGIFPSLDQSALQGNLGICSPLLKGPCKLNVPKPLVLNPYAYGYPKGGNNPKTIGSSASENPSSFRQHRFLSVSSIVAISAAIVIAIGVMVITLLNFSAKRRVAFVETAMESMCSSTSKSNSMATGKLVLFDSKRASPNWANSSPETLLNKASEIGEGVFGTVYRATFPDQTRVLAIKKLNSSNIIQYPEDFDREIRILAKARHPNLISLKGYYWTPQMQVLVSEFAPNGSLQSRLHERTPSVPPLSWHDRFKIILGTAKGIAHLHHNFLPPIIHYNIKPSNILLDENLNPKVSDFGLARLLTKLDRHVSSSRFQSAMGYVAPEFACQSLRVNEKCDIYGFGVLILEMVTGKRPVEYGEDNVVILSDHVRVMLEQGNVLECVDQSMGEYPEDEALPVLKLALVCTSQIPSSRPSMAEVVQILQVITTPVPQRQQIF